MRFARLMLALFAASFLFAAPGHAQGLRYFYCFAVDSQSGKVLMSDIQDVGPVAERAAYPEKFRVYLSARGLASSRSASYCVMRAKVEEIERGMQELPLACNECLGITRFEQVGWPRTGKTVSTLLAGQLEPPKVIETGQAPVTEKTAAPAPPNKNMGAPPAPEENSEIYGLWLMVRSDKPDLLSSANRTPDPSLLRLRADLRGGKWSMLLSDDRCTGWGAVAYASDGEKFVYFVERGADDEGEASRGALARAERYVGSKPNWHVQVLESFDNLYRQTVANAVAEGRGGVMGTARSVVGALVKSNCTENSSSGAAGARG